IRVGIDRFLGGNLLGWGRRLAGVVLGGIAMGIHWILSGILAGRRLLVRIDRFTRRAGLPVSIVDWGGRDGIPGPWRRRSIAWRRRITDLRWAIGNGIAGRRRHRRTFGRRHRFADLAIGIGFPCRGIEGTFGRRRRIPHLGLHFGNGVGG